jgi:maltooligosyltrehalose trehalohydrolase
VDLFAPSHLYGSPDDFRRFVDRAHAAGIGVILDVVYNHLGPDGNYLKEFSAAYFTDRHSTDWGEAINFDGPGSAPVREFYVANARHWIDEYHLNGFRFDATQALMDNSGDHIIAEVLRAARNSASSRGTFFIAENEPQDTRYLRQPCRGGFGMDAMWNDDFHHSAMVALSGRSEAYMSDYRGRPQEFISAAKWGYLYQGQRYKWQQARRGTPGLDLPASSFVNFIQNHDQVANSGLGLRVDQLTSPGQLRAMTALLLLLPQTPMLFQGQEFAASSRFHYFADHCEQVAGLVRTGRAAEMTQFNSLATPAMQAALPDPCDRATFERSKLNHDERDMPGHAQVLRLHRDLLALRRKEAVLRRISRRGDIDGAVLGPDAFCLRFFGDCVRSNDDRLLLVNLGTDLLLDIAPEPLLAPPNGRRWAVVFSSEDVAYGGGGTPAIDTEEEGFFLPGRCTVLLQPLPVDQARVRTRVKKAGVDWMPQKS